MPVSYTVKRGDYLASIADSFGFSDPDIIWNLADNSALKRLRGNGNVLFAGDQVAIPDFESKQSDCATEKRHKFVLSNKQLFLRLKLSRAFNTPLAATACDMAIDADTTPLTSDSAGKVERPCPATAKTSRVVAHTTAPFRDASVSLDIVFSGQVGWLDPVNTASGLEGRLTNLGYFLNFNEEDHDADLRSAIEEFQCDSHLVPVTGVSDAATRAKLLEVHGS